MTTFIKKDKIFYLLLITILLLFITNVISIFILYKIDEIPYRTLRRIFDFDMEGNIPSLFSTLLWLVSSCLLYLISRVDGARNRWYWLFLAIVFLYLGIDDGIGLHERLSRPVRELINGSGVFTFAWIVPYGTVLILLILMFFKFFWQLPTTTKKQFFIAGFVFVAGAIGLEMLSGPHYSSVGEQSFAFKLLYSFEELLEMIGVAIFIRALINYLSSHSRSLSIQFK